MIAAAACSSSEDDSEIPDGLRIAVEIDGKRRPPIDAERLREVEPDYQQDDSRAWRLSTLLGSSLPSQGTVLEVRGGGGESRTYSDPGRDPDGRVLALMLNRRNEPVVLRVPHGGPLPVAHGKERKKKPSVDRVHHVTRLRLYHAAEQGEGAEQGPTR